VKSFRDENFYELEYSSFFLRWYWRLEWRFSNRLISKQLEVYQKIVCLQISVRGNLYLARYKQLKFRLQGKFCGKITTTNGSNCNCGLQKHSFIFNCDNSLRYANLTVCDLKFRLWNYHKSHTLCLVCLIHASLNWISQVTFLLLDTIVFCRYQHTEMSLFVRRQSNVSFVTWHWNTSHCLELSNTTSSYWSSKS